MRVDALQGWEPLCGAQLDLKFTVVGSPKHETGAVEGHFHIRPPLFLHLHIDQRRQLSHVASGLCEDNVGQPVAAKLESVERAILEFLDAAVETGGRAGG